LERWCAGFVVRHGEAVAHREGDAITLTAVDGALARIHSPFGWPNPVLDVAAAAGGLGAAAGVAAVVGAAVGELTAPRLCAVLLVRRGGYACAVIRDGQVETSKVGTRYVQGRTAAGGWSQHRFARRRENQTNDLLGAVADVAVRLLLPLTGPPVGARAGAPAGARRSGPWLVTGGDPPLVAKVLAEHRLRPLTRLPVGPHLAVGDPRSDVVRAIGERLSSARIQLTDPPPGSI
jgi:hypothetical protein